MQWYHISTVEVAQKAAWLPTCYAWNHVVLAPLVFVPFYLIPMMPPSSAITWSLPTYWRAHRALGLRLHQVPTTGFVMLIRLLESVETVHIVGFDGFSLGKELHYYKERRMQVWRGADAQSCTSYSHSHLTTSRGAVCLCSFAVCRAGARQRCWRSAARLVQGAGCNQETDRRGTHRAPLTACCAECIFTPASSDGRFSRSAPVS